MKKIVIIDIDTDTEIINLNFEHINTDLLLKIQEMLKVQETSSRELNAPYGES